MKSPRRVKLDRVPAAERQQRRLLSGVALLGVLVELTSFVHLRGQPDFGQMGWSVGLGLVLSALLLLMSLSSRVPLSLLQRLVIGILSAWFLFNLLSVLVTHRPVTSALLIHLVILALFSFAWLPARTAVLLTGPAALLLAGVNMASRSPDLPGVLLAALTLPIIWYLSVYGHEVSRERTQSEALRGLAYRDSLTGIYNRRWGSEVLKRRLAQPSPQPGGLAGAQALALLDLDHFKRINDTLGHHQGDRVLVAVAHTLRRALPPEDAVVRWGGEEFLVILHARTAQEARARVAAALDAVRALKLDGLPPITLSAGIAYAGESSDPAVLLHLADSRLYSAKAAGRDRLF
ncbi:diguanylate cyclase [Deinococcus sp. YIM 77859]|uniref:GGDEF domain-containing protein n=1 Tax=Deinococcus sp. YIM 77859 TaxID=1540221 RepID=UPI00069218AC|nr:GGDEF domain-containing protein [Deinococcus sp. YIM 77859]